jgi:tetratricopeptide (TPR) repeat protein
MFSTERRPYLSALLATALAIPLWFASQGVLAAMGSDRPFDVSYVPHGRALGTLSPGIRLSIGNLYWLLTVQYIGDARADQRGFQKLFPLVDLVTDLDPKHGYAYQSGGIVLSTRGLLEESDRILEKGMKQGPNWWSFPFYIAFNHYFYRGDYADAAHWAEVAARTPGASPNISQLALAMKVKSGDPDDAVRFLNELLAVAKDDTTRAALEEQYKLARLQRDFRRLDESVAAFRAARGRGPSHLGELLEAGLLKAIPKEPFGGRYEIRADGKVHSTGRDFRFAPAEPWRGKLYLPATPTRRHP